MEKKYLIITSCSKRKGNSRTLAKNLYKGQFFLGVKKLAENMKYDFYILSAKYGLIPSTKKISPYDQKIQNSNDLEILKEGINKTMNSILETYEKVILLMGSNYRKVFEDYLESPKLIYAVDHRGSGGFLQLIATLNRINLKRKNNIFKSNLKFFSVEDLHPIGVQQCLI